MNYKKLQLGILGLSTITSIVAYKYLPETIASHWNYLGQVDAYSSKLGNLILFPALLVFFLVLLKVVPKLDPLNKNIKEFNNEFEKFISMMMIFFVLVQYQVILWSMGYQITPNIFFPIALGFLFYFIGELLEKSKRNWSIGIRTSWTLSSDKVWDKTHVLGGKLFKYSLPIFVLSAIIPKYSFFVVLGYIFGITTFLIYYSYKEFKKEQK